HLRPAARWPGHVHGRQPDPAAVPRGPELALRSRVDDRDDGLPARLDAAVRALGDARLPGGVGMSAPGWAARLPLARRRAERRRRRGFDRPRFLLAFFLLFVVWTFAPLLVVALFSFNSTPSLQNFEGFSLQWYDEFFSSVTLRESLVASIEIGFVTMIVGTVLGTTLAFALVRARSRVAQASNVLMLIPLVTPEIVA